jgi:FkbM family methyltransferase
MKKFLFLNYLLYRIKHNSGKNINSFQNYVRKVALEEETARLRGISRYTFGETTLIDGQPFQFVDSASFLSSYRQIFLEGVYEFCPGGDPSLIIDCGSNIGLSILYWKKRFPNARVIGFEPDKKIFEVLRRNCKNWELSDVELINKAVWYEEKIQSFWVEGADSGRLTNENNLDQCNQIETVRLKDYLNSRVNFLKVDIEGAETDVLVDCSERLRNVDYLFVEYHSFIHEQQRLDEILSVLRENNFRYFLRHELSSKHPLNEPFNYNGMDQSINIYAQNRNRQSE